MYFKAKNCHQSDVICVLLTASYSTWSGHCYAVTAITIQEHMI
jgi:hypothetical protein